MIEHEQFEDAQEALDRLAFEIPAERMSLDVGLLQIKLALAHKEFQRAFTGCRLLAPVAENEPRQSELLYDTIESGLALGKTDDARRALAQLLKNFPYSESAAKAKDTMAATIVSASAQLVCRIQTFCDAVAKCSNPH